VGGNRNSKSICRSLSFAKGLLKSDIALDIHFYLAWYQNVV
jgi:hypothetical protein